MLRVMGVIAPPASAGLPRRILGILLIVLFLVVVMVVAYGIVKLVALPFGGIGATAWFYGLLLLVVAFGVLFFFGRRRQAAARAKAAEQRAATFGGKR
jgi:cytochrome c-type biogenesis protein CcmH/NrfF